MKRTGSRWTPLAAFVLWATVACLGLTPGPASAEPFTLVIIPDTQFYTAQTNGGTLAMFTAQTQWIVDNRVSRNIAAVAHLGDFTDNDTATEWQRAQTAMALLENPATTGLPHGIPYVPCFGNHDDNSGGTLYDQYFGVSRFSGRSYYGGHFGSNNKNNYILFSAGGLDWVMVSLQFHPDEISGLLAWAKGIFNSYPSRKGILITHSMMMPGGDWAPGGQETYDALKDVPNLVLAANGHLNGSGRRTDVYGSNKLTTMVSNYQGEVNGGDGYLRYLEIDPALNQVRAFTYSPYRDAWKTTDWHQFVLNDVPLGGGVPVIPAAPVATAATGVSASGFAANWNASAGAASYRLDVSTSSGFGSYVAGYQDLTVAGTSRAVSGLTASTPYYYRVRAVNDGGTSGSSNTITATTGSTPTPPAAPVATAATGVSATDFQANWNASTGAASYRLDVSTSSGFGSYVTGYQDLAVPGTSHTVSELAAETPYYYRVRAVNADGTSGNSNTVTVTTGAVPAPGGVRISQVYGGGVYWNGTGTAPAAGYYQCDYVELFNSSGAPVNIGGWSLQYGSATGSTFGSSTWNTVLIPGGATVPACGYYLIRGYCSNVGGAELPVSADLVTGTLSPPGSFSTASAAGKFALFSDQVTGRTCATAQSSGALVDLVGWGGANCAEGASAVASDDASVLVRGLGGMTDTGNNAADFAKVTASGVTIHNSSSAANPDCAGSSEPPAAPVAAAATDVSAAGFTANWNASTGAVSYRLDVSTSSGFGSYVAGYQDLTVPGTSQSVSGLAAETPYYYRVRAVNGEGTSGNSNTVTVTTGAAPAVNAVRISQVYGGGVYWNGTGDPPAAGTYQCDYVELFNSSGAPVNIGGWSLQYGSATGSTFGSSTWNTVLIPGGATVPACGYYLIRGYCSNVGGAELPVSADLVTGTLSPPGSFSTASAAGKFALFSDQVTGRTCATAQSSGALVDLVGWGGANCAEGASAVASDDASVLVRGLGGMTDTDNNAADFAKVTASGVTIHNSSSGQNPDCDANQPPGSPVLVGPLDGATGVAVPATLTVTVSDPDADALTVEFYGRAVPPPPDAPVATAATSVGSTSFTANWNASVDASGYRLDVSTSSSFASYVTGYQDLAVSGTSWSVSGLAAVTPYYYRVRAVNSGGTSGNSNTITVTTTSTPPPAAPVATAATSVTQTGFQANWNASSGATGYRLDVSTSSSFASYVAGYQDLAVSGTSRAVSGLTASTPYYYRVRAVGEGGTSGNSNTITVTTSGAAAAECELIVLPDTQEYTKQDKGGLIGMFIAQTQWVVNNRVSRNIVAVSHEGDICDSWGEPDVTTEYNRALQATNLLENPTTTGLPDGIPYSMIMGNHDYENTTKFNSVYGVNRFSGRSYYGGGYPSGTNNNSYILFSGAGLDFVLVGLSYSVSSAELTWAKSVLDAYPNRVGIVTSHAILNESSSIPAPWNGDGSAIYTALRGTPNLRLMLCGHMSESSSSPSWHGEGRRSDTYGGYTIHSLLADYQDRENGGNGKLRILQFVPAENKVRVRTYSPYTNTWEADADSSSQFTLSVDLSVGLQSRAGLGGETALAPQGEEDALADFALLGTVTGVSSGTTASWLWGGLDPLTEYEWYVKVSDGTAAPVTGPTWTFTTAGASAGVGDWGQGGLALAPPAPNPARGSLRFAFDLPRATHARLEVMDVQGRVVAVLAEGEFAAGRHERAWDATAAARADAGLYFVRLETPEGTRVRRVALLR